MVGKAIMAVQEWKIFTAVRYQVQAVRSLLSLLCLSYKDANVFKKFQNECKQKNNWWRNHFFFLRLLLSLPKYSRLFRPSKNPYKFSKSEKLNEIYQLIFPMKDALKSTNLSLSSRTGIAMERAIATSVFKELFDVKLDTHDADVLQQFSSVSVPLIRFLKYCGCPAKRTTLLPLELELKRFLLVLEEPLYKSRERQRLIEDRKKYRSLGGPIRWVWLYIQDSYLKRHWEKEDDRKHHSLIKERARCYKSLHRLADKSQLTYSQMEHRGAEIALAFKIHIKAYMILIAMGPSQSERNVGCFFKYALENLEENFSSLNIKDKFVT